MSVRLSDPRPAYCSACFNMNPDLRFIDFDVAFDSGAFVDGLGTYVAGSDDLYLCESCVRDAGEILGLKPELNSRQRVEIRRLHLENEHWKAYAKRLEGTLVDRPKVAA